ncbi:MAG TPA: bifunctional diaminohydroxyphosphoribosylaminopyrimidine deaminase/5-amino-6-(5-phosphoribosylamino)uracil reductase RibD [Drouetiella sp.]
MAKHSESDLYFMQKCLDLAQEAEGRTAPNPMVGALVVDKDNNVVGAGFHKKSGTAHAEVIALAQAGKRAVGSTLYVSLEPCCHHGKTPPCSDLVTTSGVKRLVAAMVDPNPKVAGKGIKQIKDAGIAVTVGVLEEQAEWQNRGFLKRVRSGRPWVTLKMAATLDGRIADRHGTSRWVTGPDSRLRVHELRNRYDAVLIGGNTLKADDPELTVREIANSRNPQRIALDARLEVSPTSRFCTTDSNSRTIIVADAKAIEKNSIEYPSHIQLLSAPLVDGHINLTSTLEGLAQMGINTILCEGGGKLAGSLMSAGLIDEVFWVVAPKIIGDAQAKSALHVSREVELAQAWNLNRVSVEQVGTDIWIHGTL